MDAQEPTGLEHVDDAIEQAHRAQDKLLEISPDSINPDEDEAAAEAPGGGDKPVEPDDESRTSDVTGGPRAPSDDPG